VYEIANVMLSHPLNYVLHKGMFMSAQKHFPLIHRNNFNPEQQALFFQDLKQNQFTGQLVLADSQGKQWNFYLHLGDIQYASGGTHPVRRWLRHLSVNCPHMLSHIPVRQSELSEFDVGGFTLCWEAQLLCLWVEQQRITTTESAKVIQSVLLELLLEVAQALDVRYQVNPNLSLSTQQMVIKPEQVIAEFQQFWTVFQDSEIAGYSPNFAPIIKQPKPLSEQTSTQVYQTLTNLLNGQNTLYDLAVKMKRDVVQITRSLLPFIQAGWVELMSIPDLPIPIHRDIPKNPFPVVESSGPLIACVDDDIWICKALENLLTGAGYQFITVNDPVRAIAMLIARKPELIFLDLVMPNTTGYEICSRLRKLPFFSKTPIVILTGNDGVVDQVRAKLVGASDFVSKPIESETVIKVIQKHLKNSAIGH
jgi:two-component system, chemotaxis family, response regulator PixG